MTSQGTTRDSDPINVVLSPSSRPFRGKGTQTKFKLALCIIFQISTFLINNTNILKKKITFETRKCHQNFSRSSGSLVIDQSDIMIKTIFCILVTHHHHNSKDLVEKLSNVQLNSNELLVSYDVTALFTCTPVGESLKIIESRLKNDTSLHERTNLSVEQIMSLLEYSLTTTYFQYDNVCYQQIMCVIRVPRWNHQCLRL